MIALPVERAHGAIDVANARSDTVRARPDVAALQRVVHESPVECVVESVVLLDALVALFGVGRRRSSADRSRSLVASSSRRRRRVAYDVADHFVERAHAEEGEVLAHLFGDELEEVLDELRLAGEALAQHGVLGRDAHRTGVEVTDAHHHAARDHEWCGGEAELLGAEHRGDDDVAARLELTVDLDDDAAAQSVGAPASGAPRPGRVPTACRRA